MANKVTQEDIKRFNEIYYSVKTYAEVARQTGFSPSTVKKYIDKNWTPAIVPTTKFDISILPDYIKAAEAFREYDDYGKMCGLSDEEKKEIELLWNELSI